MYNNMNPYFFPNQMGFPNMDNNMEIKKLENRIYNLEKEVNKLKNKVIKLEQNKENFTNDYQTNSYNMM